jgi:hypothetical protein
MTKSITVYVKLLNEGVPVFRPVPARVLGKDTFVLESTPDYESAEETWEFLPGTKVRCEYRQLDRETVLVAVAAS